MEINPEITSRYLSSDIALTSEGSIPDSFTQGTEIPYYPSPSLTIRLK